MLQGRLRRLPVRWLHHFCHLASSRIVLHSGGQICEHGAHVGHHISERWLLFILGRPLWVLLLLPGLALCLVNSGGNVLLGFGFRRHNTKVNLEIQLKLMRCCCFAISLMSNGQTPGKRSSGHVTSNDCRSHHNWLNRSHDSEETEPEGSSQPMH